MSDEDYDEDISPQSVSVEEEDGSSSQEERDNVIMSPVFQAATLHAKCSEKKENVCKS